MDCPPTPPQLPRDPTPPPKDEDGLRSDLKTPAKSEVERPSPSGSPEPHCAICLGQFENISKTDTCFHRFCFTCLKEWSKSSVKRTNNGESSAATAKRDSS